MCRLGCTAASASDSVALGHQFFGHRVVHAQLDEGVATEAVGAGVAHVHEHETVAVGRGHQGGGGHGGAHAPQGLVVHPVFPHGLVGLLDGRHQSVDGRVAGETGLQGFDGDGGGHLAAHVAPHAVGHGEEGAALEGAVLVDRAHPAHVGGRSRSQDGHRVAATVRPPVIGPSRRRCRRPGEGRPARAGWGR